MGKQRKHHGRSAQQDRSGRGLNFARCACGKYSYATRALAKRAARQMGRSLRAYRCGDVWHLTSQDGKSAARWRDFHAG